MELMLSGDPEEWLLEPSPGNDLLLGEPLAAGAAAELRFLRPLFLPSGAARPWEACDDDDDEECAAWWACCAPAAWWWWLPWLLWYPCLAEAPA